MAAQLDIDLRPEAALTDATRATQRLYARLGYTRQVVEDDTTVRVPATITVELDTEGIAQFTVKDGTAESPAELKVETAQGVALISKNVTFPAEGESARLTFVVPVATYRDGGERTNPAEIPLLARTGRFTRFDDTLPEFGRHRLYVAPIRGGTDQQSAAARLLLGLEDSGDLTDFEVMRLDVTQADPAAANALGLRDCAVRADGTFDFSLPVAGDEVGWFWLLLGPLSYAGYQVDSGPPRGRVTIVLPPVPAGGDPAAPAGTAGPGNGNPPMDFDEQQVIGNPGQFGDDPGTHCFPFSNPQRILGERPFFTVLRVDQPEIGGEGSLRVSPPIVLDLAPQLRASAVAASFTNPSGSPTSGGAGPVLGGGPVSGGAGPVVSGGPVLSGGVAGDARSFAGGTAVSPAALERHAAIADLTVGDARLARSARLEAVTDALAVPAAEARSRVDAALGRPVASYFRRWVLARTTNRAPVTPRNPINWEGAATLYQAGSVAGGHILEHRVQWRSNGYSLGDVAHTLTLAPRQVRRIAKVSWRRRETAVRRELTIAQDRVQQTTQRDRDYTDAVQSSLSEWAKGGSESSTTGAAGGIGFALGPVVIGGGAAHGQASSSSWQSGGRRVAASEQQSLRDAIRQFADSVRRLESTVITEVSQEEEVEGVSEVVRNVNYCHALTVIYHEILRHYRVDTSFAGVRECLFVPFSITPFDVNKALKWRDKLRGGMLARDLRWALDRLDEVATAWADSDIPEGRRSIHPIRYLSGSAYIKLSVERPRDRAEDEKMEDYLSGQWARLAPLMGMSVNAIIAQLQRNDRDRDAYFQKEIATTMAAKWCDRLKLVVGGTVIDNADFTLATTYRFGGTVRVDFTVPVDGRFHREALQDITFKSGDSLPMGSVADLVRVQLRYFTDHFEGTAESVQTTNDLVKPDTGNPDAEGAVTRFPLTQWERQDLRRVIEDAVDQLIVHLNANLVYYHKVIWWLMDRDELFMLLDGFTAPYGRRLEDGKWVEDTGRSLASVVEREPLGVLGNALVFRVAGGVFLGIDGHESPAALDSYYRDSEFRPQPLRVSLPTEGLYAQAIMDHCEAAEEHFGSTDWVLSDKEPELEALADQLGTRRATPVPTTPSEMPDTLINLQNVPAAPDPAGLAGILSAVTNASAFRDMAGLAGTQANAMGALTQAASLASSFGQMAVDFQKSKQATADAKQKLSNIKKAQDSGLIDDNEAKRQASNVLGEQNMSPKAQPLTDNEPISNALGSGQPFEVTRQNMEGVETVKVGGFGDANLIPASFTSGGGSKGASKLPSVSTTAGAQAWESVAPIAPRDPSKCPNGGVLKNMGTLLIVHDGETDIDLRDYGKYTNADAWVLVHNITDVIEAIRNRVGACGYLTGIHIEAHGGRHGQGGFRMGDPDNGDGHIDGGEANDFVSSAAEATKFGAKIKEALGLGPAFISIASCYSAGPNDAFIKALHAAANNSIVIGASGDCRSGGNWYHKAWWEIDDGTARRQVNGNGTIKTDTREDGKGIWKPF